MIPTGWSDAGFPALWRGWIFWVTLGWLLAPPPARGQAFVDVTSERGLEVLTSLANDGFGDYGSGAAFTDFDGDGDLDLYVVMGEGQPNRLYRYDITTSTYTDWAPALGCDDAHWGKAVKVCDYDNDGDQDIFLANLDGPNRLFQNDGRGNFVDATAQAGLTHTGPSHGAAWGDYDRDGFLDLYVVSHATGAPNLLYHNRGDGTFEEVAAVLGVQDPHRAPFECVWFDYDDDGDLDLYVAVDRERGNRLFRNDGAGFTDVSTTSGAGVVMNGMGIDTGDFDNDGRLDVFISNTEEGHVLLRNQGDGTFADQAAQRGVATNLLGWGTSFLDYDNDSDLDLYVVHWWTYPGGDRARNVLYRNDGAVFTDVSAETRTGDQGPGYGVVVGDTNDDGFVDLFVLNRETPSVLLENTPNGNRWLKVRPRGRVGNRDGIGAKVTARWGDQVRVREVQGGTGYLTHNSLEVELGLRQRARIDQLEIRWPSGVVDIFENVDADQRLEVLEGQTVFLPGSFFPRTATSGLSLRLDGLVSMALEDADQDGWIDLFVASGEAPGSWLLQNDGRGYFRDVAGVVGADAATTAGASAFADYDGDGDLDLFIADHDGHRLLRLVRPWQYEDVAAATGLAASGLATSASFVDYDRDGRLDLCVAYEDGPLRLFQAQPDGSFRDRAAELGLSAARAGAGVVWLDADADGDADLVASDTNGTVLLRNDGGAFVAASSLAPGEHAAMALAVSDVDADGDLDLLLADQDAMLLTNEGGFIVAATWPLAGAARAAAFFDADNDGDEDLLVVTESVDALFRNEGGAFVAAASAFHLPVAGATRALAVADHNGDGALDVVMAIDGAGLVLYEGVPTTAHWLQVRLEGVQSNREGIGARLALRTGATWQVRELGTGRGPSASAPSLAHFGLGAAAAIDELVIDWPSGVRDVWTDLQTDQVVALREGARRPLAITQVQAVAKDAGVQLRWDVNTDASVTGFVVYRRETGLAYEPLMAAPLAPNVRSYVDPTVRPGTDYTYQVAALTVDHTEVFSADVLVRAGAIALALGPNVPNPFHPRTTLAFTLPADGSAKLTIYDASGRRVRTLVDASLRGGLHERIWDGTDDVGRPVAAGQYLCRLEHAAGSATRRMILLR